MIKKKFKELMKNEKKLLKDLEETLLNWLPQQEDWGYIFKRTKYSSIQVYTNRNSNRIDFKLLSPTTNSYVTLDLIIDLFKYDDKIIEKVEKCRENIANRRVQFINFLESWIVVTRDDYKEFLLDHFAKRYKKDPNIMSDEIKIFDFDFVGCRFRVGIYYGGFYKETEYIELEEL